MVAFLHISNRDFRGDSPQRHREILWEGGIGLRVVGLAGVARWRGWYIFNSPQRHREHRGILTTECTEDTEIFFTTGRVGRVDTDRRH